MTSSIGEPFLLSSYSLPEIPTQRAGSSKIYATYNKGLKSADGYVTVTAQGEGIHVIDLSTLHSIVSHTHGSHTTFCGPALSRHYFEDGDHICTTYALVHASTNVNAAEQDRTIWITTQNLSRASTRETRRSVVVPHPVSTLHIISESPLRVLIASSDGEISLLDAELNVQSTLKSSQKNPWLKFFIFSRQSCSFLPPSESGDVFISIHPSSASTLQIIVTAVGGDETLSLLGDCQIPITGSSNKKSPYVVSLCCTESGRLSFINANSSWCFYQLHASNGQSVTASPIGEQMQLARLRLKPISGPSFENGLSILPLTPSIVLLAAVSDASEIILQLWDLQYSVLIASQQLAVPGSLTDCVKRGLNLQLFAIDHNHGLLTLSPVHSLSKSSDQNATNPVTVHVIPLAGSLKSSLASAMGRAAATAACIVQSDPTLFSQAKVDDGGRAKLLQEMRSSIQADATQKADQAFFKWMKAWKEDKNGGACATHPAHVIGHDFVRDVLNIVLRTGNISRAKYSPRVVQHLLEQQLISASMVQAGLLSALLSCNDWETIMRTFDTVLDLSEDDIVSTLKVVIDLHRKQEAVSSGDPNAMQVDTSQFWTPLLPTYLSSCVSYVMPSAALRVAIRQHILQAEDLLCLLEILLGWIDSDSDDHSFLRILEKPYQNGDARAGAPSYHKVISFLQALLDASFITLVQYQPAHALLQKMLTYVEPEVVLIDLMEKLRGSLEPFAQAHTRMIKVKVEGLKEPQMDWRKKRRNAHDQASLGIAEYRLEELVI